MDECLGMFRCWLSGSQRNDSRDSMLAAFRDKKDGAVTVVLWDPVACRSWGYKMHLTELEADELGKALLAREKP